MLLKQQSSEAQSASESFKRESTHLYFSWIDVTTQKMSYLSSKVFMELIQEF
jgi:hypothetical protein